VIARLVGFVSEDVPAAEFRRHALGCGVTSLAVWFRRLRRGFVRNSGLRRSGQASLLRWAGGSRWRFSSGTRSRLPRCGVWELLSAGEGRSRAGPRELPKEAERVTSGF